MIKEFRAFILRGNLVDLAVAVVFFLVVKPINALLDRFQTEQAVEEETRECPHCISQIPVRAGRCSFRTSEVSPASA